MSLTFYLNIVMSGLLTGLVYGLSALGLSLIFAVTRIVNLAHGGLMAIGLWSATALAAKHGADPLLAMPMVAAGLFLGGFLLHRLLINRVVRPLTAEAPDQRQPLVMLGLALILAAGLALLPGTDGHAPRPADMAFGPFLLDRSALRAALMAGIVTALLVLFFNLGSAGKAIRACADNPFGARVIGLNLDRLQAVAFGLGAAITGVSGCLLAHADPRPAPALDWLALGLIVALTGGLGNIGGALLGGMLIGVAEALTGTLLAPGLRDLSGSVVVLLVLALRPYGLLGQSE